ncbi:ATP-binding cassette sub-family A member 2-like isoform X1 [Clavelina lepadiformis]|uniref:ATP-binding cassette sub-family A member 2-like isoform X1 n=1 Tax=Clavelina lepadiformis TaxID=159417 RepID=UPI004043800B
MMPTEGGYARNFFDHALFVLLWKNLILKRSSLWVTIFELTTPIALFLILVGLRAKEPIKFLQGSYFHPRPLPSAGLVSVLQEFCPSDDGTDKYGYSVHKNSMVGPFLDHVHHVWENSSSAQKNLNFSKALDQFNQAWSNMSKDSNNLNHIFHNNKIRGQHVFQIVKNSEELKRFLINNVSLSSEDATSLLNSTINFKSVFEALDSEDLLLPNLLPKSEQMHRLKRSVPFFVPFSNLFDDNEKPLRTSSDLIKHSQYKPSKSAINSLLQSALYKGIFTHSSNWKEKQGKVAQLTALEHILLQPHVLRSLVCQSHYDIIKMPESANRTLQNNVTDTLCNEDNDKFDLLSQELLSQINNSALLEDITDETNNYAPAVDGNYIKALEAVIRDLDELRKLETFVNSLAEIAKIVPKNSCASFEHPKTSDTSSVHNVTGDKATNASVPFQNYTTIVPPQPITTEAPPRKSNPSRDYLGLWLSIQPLICGQKKKFDLKTLTNSNVSKEHLTWAQKHNLGLLLHVLTSNPKILYAPNNTQVDQVIKNANTSFAIIDNITRAGDMWRNMSKEIRKNLNSKTVTETLNFFQNLQGAYRRNPDLVSNLTLGNPVLQHFVLDNQTLPNRTHIEKQLDEIDNAACGWKTFVSGISINWFKGFSTENDAVLYATSEAYHDNATVFATLVFEVDKEGKLPSHVKYKIRQNASFTQDTTLIRLSYWRPEPYAWNFLYYMFGFVWLQDVIERAIIWFHVGHDVVSPGAYVHEMPYPCFRYDAFTMNLEHILPLAMIISWVYTVAMFVQHIVYEKERRLKEVMKIMGLSNGIHWLAWFISIFLQLEVTVTVIALLLKYGVLPHMDYGGVLPKSNFLIIWLFFTVYAAATIMFCFLVSVLFSKAKVASACSGIIYFMSYLPFAYMSIQEFVLHESISSLAKNFGSLLSTTAFGLGAKYFAVYELSGYGIQWDNLAQSPIEGDTFSLQQSMFMLAVDFVVYAFLTWYIEAVFPGQYGLPRPWYFPMTWSYWMGHGGTESECPSPRSLWKRLFQPTRWSIMEEDQAVAIDNHQQDADIEPEPVHLKLGVSIQKLTKIYKRRGKKAVDRLSLNFYENQITSFLGHNGAGKTTTLSILTGLFPPTSGTAYVYDCDIRNDMLNIRKSLGMCPQHNALFDVLTVQEHLWFYARLKGVGSETILKEMDQFLIDVGLEEKRKSKVNTLSGGMKRKLSVAIAFVGGSRTVILDEPTAGVDPYARRAIWDLIIKYKEGRTILLSTHHMDEADLLGDRIAIISNGKLQCCGSSLFLKSMYGEGYSLTLLKKMQPNSENIADSSHGPQEPSNENEVTQDKLTKFVHRHVPSALVTYNSANQTSYNLPFEAARKGCFHHLFEELPRNMEELNVSSYGLSDTTLEEVFLKVDEKNRWESESSSLPEKGDKLGMSPSRSSLKSSSSLTGRLNQDSHQVSSSSQSSPRCSYSSSLSTSDGATSFKSSVPAQGYLPPQTSTLAPTSGDNRDTEIALEWLNSAPVKDSFDVAEHREEDDEAMLLDFAFGDSSFTHHLSDLERKTTTGLHPTPLNPVPETVESIPNDDDDVPLLDLNEEGQMNEGQGSYELSSHVHNIRILQGLLMKRFHYARRNRKAIFYQIMLPALFVIIAMTVALTVPKPGDPPPILLSPSQYHNLTQPRGNFIPYSDQSVIYPLHGAKRDDAGPGDLINTFWLASGVGATCVLKSDSTFNFDLNVTLNSAASGDMQLVLKYFNPECQSSFTRGIPLSQFVPPTNPKVTPGSNMSETLDKDTPCKCAADGNSYVCREGYGESVKTRKVVTGDRLVDVTGEEPILPYLKYTTDDYRLHRYGALSLGEIKDGVKENFPGWPSPLRKIAVRDAAQVIYNHKGYHSMPIYLNVFNNALLRANLPKSKGNPAAYGITVTNHPMNKTAGALSLDFLRSGSDVIIAIFIIVAMSFVPASFLVFLVAEKQSRAKHLQFISGTGPVTYWLANYLWDMLNYLFPALLCIMILQLFDLPAYTRGENAYAVVALFLLYGWSMTPMMYPASFYFTVPSTAYVCLIVLNLFFGITTVVTTFMIAQFRDDNHLLALNEKLEIAFLLFPNYNLGKGLMDLTFIEYMNEYYTKIGQLDKVQSPFAWKLITRQLVAMVIEGVVFFLITLLFEVRFFTRRSRSKDSSTRSRSLRREDVDVANERHRVEQMREHPEPDEMIIVDNMSKVYSKKQGRVLAVDGLSFSVGRGECFGLLGVNGAGKTTTFHVITGASEVTQGDIKVAGHNIATGRARERLSAQQATGYCPQFDALFNELTTTEHILLYARLRGIPHKDEKRVADWAIKKLDLLRHKDKIAGELSGGNRRKLSVAIALVGYPSVVLLDEPTAGMDPGARRFLWDLILDVTKSGRAVLLTSHSMEECEVLCGRIAIMVNGKFECVGPTQHLKTRFGDGYMVSVRSQQPDKVVQVFGDEFPDAVLKEQHYHKAVFQLSFAQEDGSSSLARVFQLLEDRREDLKVEDYSVSQTTLDDVFINFAKRQRSRIEENKSSFRKWKDRFLSWKSRAFGHTQLSPRSASREDYPNSMSRSNLNLRGSPSNATVESDGSEPDELEGEDQPLYNFNQSMTLSFVDSSC